MKYTVSKSQSGCLDGQVDLEVCFFHIYTDDNFSLDEGQLSRGKQGIMHLSTETYIVLSSPLKLCFGTL